MKDTTMAANQDFQYDVFLSLSAKDNAVVRPLAERLQKDGLKVWPVPPKRQGEGGFDEWVFKPGHNIPVKIEEGLPRLALQPLAFSLQPRSARTGRSWKRARSGCATR